VFFPRYANRRGAKSAKRVAKGLLALLALPQSRNIGALIHHSEHLSIAVARCVGPVQHVRSSAANLALWTGVMQDPGYGLPRTPLLGTSVNKGKERKWRGHFPMEEEYRAPARRGVICRAPGLVRHFRGHRKGGASPK